MECVEAVKLQGMRFNQYFNALQMVSATSFLQIRCRVLRALIVLPRGCDWVGDSFLLQQQAPSLEGFTRSRSS